MTMSSNPLDLDFAGITKWAEEYVAGEKKKAHILTQPAPALLTTAYAEDTVNGLNVTGEWVKRACERHLKDLEKSKSPNYPWEFDEERAWRPIRFIEAKCRSIESSSEKLVLQPWQHFVVGSLFGWINKKTGLRRFTEGLIFVGRKNGKTTLEAGLADYMAGFDNETGANVYILANSDHQASILYNKAKKMIEHSPWLKERFDPKVSSIDYPKTDGQIRKMSADSKDKDGENLHFGVFDEIHEYQDYSLINVMKRSEGMRKQPMIVYITTAGTVLDGPLVDFVDQGKDCLKNYDDNINERTFYFMASLDSMKEADDPSKWVKANPNIGLMNIVNLISSYKKERRSPKEYADWITKQFNIFAETDDLSFVTPETIQLNNKNIDLSVLDGMDCVGGYDLSNSEDFTSACLEFPLEDGSVFLLEKSWIPQKRFERDKNPERIKDWERRGEIEIIPGNYVDFSYVFDWFKEQTQKYNILQINYDPAKALRLNNELENAGFATQQIRQGYFTLGGPMQNIKELLLDGKVIFNNQKMFKWYLNNVHLITDRNNNFMPSKQSRSRKIDGFAAFLDAHVTVVGMLANHEEEKNSPGARYFAI